MSGLISVRAPPSTRATCDFLYLSARVTASVRLSSSRNCENSGANLRVSACAERRFHHFDTITVREKIDMMAMRITMPLAKLPIAAQRPASDRSIVFESPDEELALLERERERLLHELLHLATTDLGWIELHAGQGVLHRLGELLVTRLEHFE